MAVGSAGTRILILGGGFAGVATAQALERSLGQRRGVEITLVNRENFFLFQPLLPEVISGAIEANHILTPLRLMFRRVAVHVGAIEDIDLAARVVTVSHGPFVPRRYLSYDHLVLALGSTTDLSGLPGLAQHGFPLKTIGDAFHLRNHIIRMLEEADLDPDPEHRRGLLTFVVAGGGFTGVEVAAEIADLVQRAIPHYPRIRPGEARVLLLHSRRRLMPELSQDLADVGTSVLQRQGIDLWLERRLTGATATEALLRDGESIPTRTLVGTIGTAPNPLVAGLPLPKDAHGRLLVDASLRVQDHPTIWALGDGAAVPSTIPGELSPPSAQYAVREGRTLAANLVATLIGGPLRPFAFTGLGQMVSLGRHRAVADVLGRKLTGFPAWWLWRTFYLLQLPGFQRKARVALDWTLDLVFDRDICEVQVDRSARVLRVHYEPDEVIVRQDDPADLFYIIEQGEVEVVRQEAGQPERRVARLGSGETFGEIALLRATRRTATVRSVTAVDVLALSREDFRFLSGHWALLRESLNQQAAHRLVEHDGAQE
ncbi:MAG: FAD-dependent oxidoreductase [Chloroflexi bacterium]|nr:FAD-dependent oxidoreductase [Chloroflexota bacterium]